MTDATAAPRHPKIEVDVDADLARVLLREQHPDLADLPLHHRVHGWDNVTWRLGEELALRFPVRELSAPLIEREQVWLGHLASLLPVPVPVPVRRGTPSGAAPYPWPWSVVPWLPGTMLASVPVEERRACADTLAETLAALHVPAPPDAPVNPFRGVPPATRDDVGAARLTADLPHADVLRAAWADALAAPARTAAPVWVHGDPHPANLLAHDGRLAGLLDFGDLCSGDPASDLATAWMSFDAVGRARFVARTQELRAHDDATWRRARGWAAAMVPTLLAHPDEYPLLAAVGRHTAAQLAAA